MFEPRTGVKPVGNVFVELPLPIDNVVPPASSNVLSFAPEIEKVSVRKIQERMCISPFTFEPVIASSIETPSVELLLTMILL